MQNINYRLQKYTQLKFVAGWGKILICNTFADYLCRPTIDLVLLCNWKADFFLTESIYSHIALKSRWQVSLLPSAYADR